MMRSMGTENLFTGLTGMGVSCRVLVNFIIVRISDATLLPMSGITSRLELLKYLADLELYCLRLWVATPLIPN